MILTNTRDCAQQFVAQRIATTGLNPHGIAPTELRPQEQEQEHSPDYTGTGTELP